MFVINMFKGNSKYSFNGKDILEMTSSEVDEAFKLYGEPVYIKLVDAWAPLPRSRKSIKDKRVKDIVEQDSLFALYTALPNEALSGRPLSLPKSRLIAIVDGGNFHQRIGRDRFEIVNDILDLCDKDEINERGEVTKSEIDRISYDYSFRNTTVL